MSDSSPAKSYGAQLKFETVPSGLSVVLTLTPDSMESLEAYCKTEATPIESALTTMMLYHLGELLKYRRCQ